MHYDTIFISMITQYFFHRTLSQLVPVSPILLLHTLQIRHSSQSSPSLLSVPVPVSLFTWPGCPPHTPHTLSPSSHTGLQWQFHCPATPSLPLPNRSQGSSSSLPVLQVSIYFLHHSPKPSPDLVPSLFQSGFLLWHSAWVSAVEALEAQERERESPCSQFWCHNGLQ